VYVYPEAAQRVRHAVRDCCVSVRAVRHRLGHFHKADSEISVYGEGGYSFKLGAANTGQS